MKRLFLPAAGLAVLLLAACSSSAPSSAPADAAADTAPLPPDAGGATDAANDAAPAEIRGQRYCEILLATVMSPNVHVEVYNTFGLDDCPDAAWSQVSATAVAQQAGVTQAILNGPRYWMLDAFVTASLVDTTPTTLGGIAMRHAANIDMPLADLSASMKPYAQHMIQRTTTVVFRAGSSVYELVDPQGKIYDMQSYSTQITPQTEADLANLGAKLTLPSGWTFRTRVLSADLTVTALGGVAVVVQDDLANTYQQSQQ